MLEMLPYNLLKVLLSRQHHIIWWVVGRWGHTPHCKGQCAAFGQLRNRLWNEDGVHLKTKIDVIPCCRTRHSSVRLWDMDHLQTSDTQSGQVSSQMLEADNWHKDKIPCTEVLQHCGMTGIEALLMQAQLHWSGHLIRMPDTRLPKAIFYSQLASGSRLCGHPIKRYKDSLKTNLQLCNIYPATWETIILRLLWRCSCTTGVSHFEPQRITICSWRMYVYIFSL